MKGREIRGKEKRNGKGNIKGKEGKSGNRKCVLSEKVCGWKRMEIRKKKRMETEGKEN